MTDPASKARRVGGYLLAIGAVVAAIGAYLYFDRSDARDTCQFGNEVRARYGQTAQTCANLTPWLALIVAGVAAAVIGIAVTMRHPAPREDEPVNA